MFRIKRKSFVSYHIIVTLLTAILVGFIGFCQIESAGAQITNTSSISELIDKGNSLFFLGRYEEAITWYDKALAVEPENVDTLNNN